MKRENINGLTLGYIQKGKGESLVLLHGGVSDSRYWDKHIESLANEFEIVAWDAPGCGISEDPPKNFNLGDYADSLAGLLHHLEIKKPHILGISFGGGLAIEFYERYPHFPKTLILVSAYAGWAGSLAKEEIERRVRHAQEQMKMDRESVSEAWLPSLFSDSATDAMKKDVKSVIKDFHREGTQVMLEAFAEADLRYVLPKIEVPTLLLYGEKDERSPIHVAQDLHTQIPTSTLEIIPGVGHLVNMEAPKLFESTVSKFIKSHSQIN